MMPLQYILERSPYIFNLLNKSMDAGNLTQLPLIFYTFPHLRNGINSILIIQKILLNFIGKNFIGKPFLVQCLHP